MCVGGLCWLKICNGLGFANGLQDHDACSDMSWSVQGDSVEILTITKQGVQREMLDLKKD